MTTGRNDPCPCGSGKKFKKCCLGKNRAASVLPPAADLGSAPTPSGRSSELAGPSRAARRAPPPPPLPYTRPPKPAPRPRTPEEERWDARWKEFESSQGEGR